MAGPELWLAFAAATVGVALFPGPAVLYTAARTLAQGRRAGLLAVLGTHVGCYAHVVAAAFGLSAVLAAVPTLYLVVKLAGAAYLVWLGLGMIFARRARATALPIATPTARRTFGESVAVQALNPKVALFFLAFLPQFVDPSSSLPVWTQLLGLGVIVNVTFSLSDTLVVFAAAAVMRRVSRAGPAQRLIRWVSGSLLVGLGVKLATDRA